MIDIPHIAGLVQSMVRKALDAFVHRDADLARSVLASDDAVDSLRTACYHELTSFMEKDQHNIQQALNLMVVIRNLERIADHSTNIAEDVLFLVKGIDVRHHAEVPPQGWVLKKAPQTLLFLGAFFWGFLSGLDTRRRRGAGNKFPGDSSLLHVE